jgi:hypothetical protein
MPDNHDEDSEYKEWAASRKPDEAPDVPASVTFMEMMRQAAARSTPETPEEQLTEATPPQDTAEESEPLSEPSPRRVRRRVRRTPRAVGVLGGMIRSLVVVIVAAGLTATIFTWWTRNEFFSDAARAGLSIAIATDAVTLVPTSLPTPNWARRIGVVSGHRGPENEALVSIHANTCQDFGERVSGFLIAAAAARITARGGDNLLVDCIVQHYAAATQLERREGVTIDMTDYHTFREIHPLTPAAIIELGFLLADRQLLTEHPDTLARGITDGILCYLEPGQK